jgi:hypothetical protein
MQEAQRDYDKVKWAGDAGMTSKESADLQSATIDYESGQSRLRRSRLRTGG